MRAIFLFLFQFKRLIHIWWILHYAVKKFVGEHQSFYFYVRKHPKAANSWKWSLDVWILVCYRIIQHRWIFLYHTHALSLKHINTHPLSQSHDPPPTHTLSLSFFFHSLSLSHTHINTPLCCPSFFYSTCSISCWPKAILSKQEVWGEREKLMREM